MTDVNAVLAELGRIAPTRLTGTPGERKLQEHVRDRLSGLGYVVRWQNFRFPRHIYGSLALHFGLALAFLGIGQRWAHLGAAGHALVAYSFWSEAVRRRHVLRKLWPAIDTQNLVATFPARTSVRRRLVFAAHTDSAFTGLMFSPKVVPLIAKPPPSWLPFLRKQLLLPFVSVLALVGLELASTVVRVPTWPFVACAVPCFLVFALNADVVIRNQVVPGAADNLTGVAAQIVLAEKWAASAAPDVEVVFAFTGCEEAGTGGAAHLARTMGWDRSKTDIVVLDTLSNGTLFLLEEGELFRRERPLDLGAVVQRAATACGQPSPDWYIIPAGATDALPFLVEGYRALALTCIDTSIGAPRNYHHPNDTVANVDPVQLERSTRIAEHAMFDLAIVGSGARPLDAAAE